MSSILTGSTIFNDLASLDHPFEEFDQTIAILVGPRPEVRPHPLPADRFDAGHNFLTLCAQDKAARTVIAGVGTSDN